MFYKIKYIVFKIKILTALLLCCSVGNIPENAVYKGFKEKDFVKGKISHLDIFCKKGVLKNFVIYTGKFLCWSLF